jgi:ribosomal protein S18 acetylase RimI-like enzyme
VTRFAIRDAAAADAERIAAIAQASWTETYRDIFDAAFIKDFLAANYEVAQLAVAAEHASGADDHHVLVAERGGEIVAFAEYGVGPRGPQLFRIYADPEHYGTGAGHALLQELHRRLAGRVDGYVLDVHSRNERGMAFYRRQGFVVTGGGATPDCDVTLRRDLTEAGG